MENEKKERGAFERLCGTVGFPMAIFCLCAVYDVPFIAGIEADTWAQYQEKVRERPDRKCFRDGETDVNFIILEGMEITERWETVWGAGYSGEDYKRLDDLYRTMTAQLDANGGVVDKQQEDVARYCSRLALEREKLVMEPDKDNIEMASKMDRMIRENLKDCRMRKADVLPSEKQRLDGFVDALRERTGLDTEMTYDEVMQAIYGWMRQRKYTMTMDAAEHMLLSIQKTMARNDDLPEPQELTKDQRMDAYASEFAEEPNEQEIETYRYLGMVREDRR